MIPHPTPRPPTTPTGPATLPIRSLTALAALPTDPHWRQRLSLHLADLHRAFAVHVRLTEGPDGRYAEPLADAPRLARRVQILLREHIAVDTALHALRRRADLPEAGADELHDWLTALLVDLHRHRRHGAELVHQAYQTDLGGET
ncbi:hypothetical protein V6U90_13975 [Micromonospora sp. CPCC 206060]|uniref:hypothetical protein n=1 Tax=Micromonospora sp. CPCC 206060 TaxID=3122406 RepID=UPI002FF04B5C